MVTATAEQKSRQQIRRLFRETKGAIVDSRLSALKLEEIAAIDGVYHVGHQSGQDTSLTYTLKIKSGSDRKEPTWFPPMTI